MTKCEYFFFIFVLLIKISVELGKKNPCNIQCCCLAKRDTYWFR